MCVRKATQDFFSEIDESLDLRLTLCWANISHWSTACLRYWYSLQSCGTGYKTYPLSPCSSWMAGSSRNPLLQIHTQCSPSLQIPLPLSAAASGVWAWIDEAYFWSHYFSHAHLILRFIKQDLGWQRTLASANHSFSSHWSAPLCPWYLQGRMVHCRLNPKQKNKNIKLTALWRLEPQPNHCAFQ